MPCTEAETAFSLTWKFGLQILMSVPLRPRSNTTTTVAKKSPRVALVLNGVATRDSVKVCAVASREGRL